MRRLKTRRTTNYATNIWWRDDLNFVAPWKRNPLTHKSEGGRGVALNLPETSASELLHGGRGGRWNSWRGGGGNVSEWTRQGRSVRTANYWESWRNSSMSYAPPRSSSRSVIKLNLCSHENKNWCVSDLYTFSKGLHEGPLTSCT